MDIRVFIFVLACVFMVEGKKDSCSYKTNNLNSTGGSNGLCSVQVDGKDECDCRIYEFFCQGMYSYHAEAKAECERLGGSLAILDNEMTSVVIHEYIEEFCLHEDWCIGASGFYIGLGDHVEEGEYVWDHTSGVCVKYTDWADGEPNNNNKQNKKDGQDCVQLWYKNKSPDKWGKWDDEYCRYRPKGFICGYKIPYCNFDKYWNRAIPEPCGADARKQKQ